MGFAVTYVSEERGFCGGFATPSSLHWDLQLRERWTPTTLTKSTTLFSNNFRFSVLLTRLVSTLNLN